MFEQGRTYHRMNELHAKYGGQRYGGISTPRLHPVVLLFTGEEGLAYGYSDGWKVDGSFHYSGEGQVGAQTFTGGNKAVRDHSAEGNDLHLFAKEADTQYRYIGQFVYGGHHFVQAADREKNTRDVIMFELVPLDATLEDAAPTAPDEQAIATATLGALRALALDAGTGDVRQSTIRARVWLRSAAVTRYARERAQGVCEGCGHPAPFSDSKGRPFLEVHHLRRLSDGGPDEPQWVAAICPNCHRRAHHAEDATSFNMGLTAVVADIERNWTSSGDGSAG